MQETITQIKKCSKCKTEKTFDMFNKSKKEKDGLQTYCKHCKKHYFESNKKETDKEYFINYRSNNREKILLQKKEYRIKYKEKISSYAISYLYNHKGYYKKYSQTERGKAAIKNSNHNRRSLKKNGDATTQQLLELQQSAKVCYWCNEPLKNKKVHIDHYIPLSKGGEHTISNLVVSCEKCNKSKHAKDPIKFANSIGKLL